MRIASQYKAQLCVIFKPLQGTFDGGFLENHFFS